MRTDMFWLDEVQGIDYGGVIDPDCRDGKHGSCFGDPCECECHK